MGMDKLEMWAAHDGVVNQIVANATDALKRCVIGQAFTIALPNAEDGHLHRLEHVNFDFIIYLNRIAREFLNDRAYLCLNILIIFDLQTQTDRQIYRQTDRDRDRDKYRDIYRHIQTETKTE